MVEKREIGSIQFGPEGEHTRSLMNPPAAALAQRGRESKRAYESDCRAATDAEIGEWAEAVGVDRGAADIALGVRMSEQFQGPLNEEEVANLARKIVIYGDERVGDFQEELRRGTE